MNFRTEIKIKPSDWQIDHQQKIRMMGSCFTQNIGAILVGNGFDVKTNPFGISYNPVAIANSILEIQQGKIYRESNLVHHRERWHSMLHHSIFSDSDKETTLKKINESIQQWRKYLLEADVLILSLGTAWVYEKNGKTVNNCHQIPNKEFQKRILSSQEIIDNIISIRDSLSKNTKIILTVSPIRHLKDGLEENSRSKSTLIHSCHEVTSLCENAEYFPSYEILMDDLRDYRFFEKDMLHPNEMAIEYIWDKFQDKYMSLDTKNIIKKVEKIRKSEKHIVFQPDSNGAREFEDKLQMEKLNLLKMHPYLQL